ncbi:hypothetical protein [Amycolatopsis bullii]|uniref:hypothetical protein n=1 Tax=Amycolatopsis bullii TaxID=941987 RepID=UPI001E3ED6A1|nr:hypothetical protein [Amycolatopsis bullii]
MVMFFVTLSPRPDSSGFDGWGTDGFVHYTGEGQGGDQQFTQGNKAILNHRRDGRTLEGFAIGRSGATYLGEFQYAGHYRVDAPDEINTHLLRQLIVFQLKPLGELPIDLPKAAYVPATGPVLEEARFIPRTGQRLRRSTRAERAELVDQYMLHLERAGHDVRTLRILPPGEAQPFAPILWNRTSRELVDVRVQVTRDQVRNGIGTLLDGARFVEAESLALLVPTRPRPDLLELLARVGITAVYQDDDGWVRVEPAEVPNFGHVPSTQAQNLQP